ncbi:hypothetical protein MRX96_028663 [Rhipicephalus microplus]
MDEPEAVVEEMEQDCLADDGPSLMDLPDNVLMKICQYSEPFDVLSLGMTCRRLCELTSSRFLWTSLALSWCRGAWHYLPDEVGYGPEDPKQWFCNLLQMCRRGLVQQIERALLENGETWLRIQDDRFSCKPFLDPVGLHWREVMSRCAAMLKEHGTVDAIVDMPRIRWRRVLLFDIEAVVGPRDGTLVSRINLTDGGTVGGDNPRQAIAAAFVSQSGVLVTWQLLLQNLQ